MVDFSEHLVKGETIGAVPMTSRSILWQELSCPACEVHKTEWRTAERYCAVAIHEELEDEFAVPLLKKEETYDPSITSSEFQEVLVEYKSVFSTNPGNTSLMQHSIPTSGCHPARVPPRRIPAHYRVEVEKQLNDMIEQGIISRSTSSWVAPAVYVRKKTGELILRVCVDYRELNKRTETTAYSVPLPDEVQDRLAGASIFTKLDFKSGFWQVIWIQKMHTKLHFHPGLEWVCLNLIECHSV